MKPPKHPDHKWVHIYRFSPGSIPWRENTWIDNHLVSFFTKEEGEAWVADRKNVGSDVDNMIVPIEALYAYLLLLNE